MEAVHADDTLSMGGAWVLNGLCDAVQAAAPLIPEHPACDDVLPLFDEAEGKGTDPSDHLASVLSWAIFDHLMMRDHSVLQQKRHRGVSHMQQGAPELEGRTCTHGPQCSHRGIGLLSKNT